MVSEIHICLFEIDKWSLSNVFLVFWANMRTLVTIKKYAKENTVKFFLKQHFKKELYELVLDFENSHILVGKIVKTMKSLGINYKVNKLNQPKSGVLPQINIDFVETKLNNLEAKMLVNPESSGVDEVNKLYQNVREIF